jgi:hypothetical protein
MAIAREQLAWTDSIFRGIASRHPYLHLAWPFDSFCDVRRCSAMRNHTVLYRDNDHLNVAGSRYFGSTLKRPLQDLLRP